MLKKGSKLILSDEESSSFESGLDERSYSEIEDFELLPRSSYRSFQTFQGEPSSFSRPHSSTSHRVPLLHLVYRLFRLFVVESLKKTIQTTASFHERSKPDGGGGGEEDEDQKFTTLESIVSSQRNKRFVIYSSVSNASDAKQQRLTFNDSTTHIRIREVVLLVSTFIAMNILTLPFNILNDWYNFRYCTHTWDFIWMPMVSR